MYTKMSSWAGVCLTCFLYPIRLALTFTDSELDQYHTDTVVPQYQFIKKDITYLNIIYAELS